MPKSWWDKKSKKDEKTSREFNSAHRRSQAKCQLLQTSYMKRIKLFLFSPYNKNLINRAKSVCMGESWPRSCVQTSLPHCVRSVLTTSVKILPYRPARLIRAKYWYCRTLRKINIHLTLSCMNLGHRGKKIFSFEIKFFLFKCY